MNAIALLEAQHKKVEALFKSIEKARDEAKKRDFFEELAAALVGHDAIEREIFYPACEKAMGKDDLGEALVEHGVVEFSLYLADESREDDFDHKVKVLREIVEHHVEEEEGELLPKAAKALGEERLTELGARMQARFEETQQTDFRAPLHKNLKLVLAGVTEAGVAEQRKTSQRRVKHAPRH